MPTTITLKEAQRHADVAVTQLPLSCCMDFVVSAHNKGKKSSYLKDTFQAPAAYIHRMCGPCKMLILEVSSSLRFLFKCLLLCSTCRSAVQQWVWYSGVTFCVWSLTFCRCRYLSLVGCLRSYKLLQLMDVTHDIKCASERLAAFK